MRFSKITALLASAATVRATENTITLKSLDDVGRTIYFTGNPGSQAPQPVRVEAGSTVVVPVPYKFAGNFYAVQDGNQNKPGMLGEVAFDAFAGIHYYDVSGIVNITDVDNVSQMWGANDSVAPWTPPTSPLQYSGCVDFSGCTNFYIHPDDTMTRSTSDCNIITTLGKNGATATNPNATSPYVTSVHSKVKRDPVAPLGLPRDCVLAKN